MEFFKIRRVIPFMRHALVFNIISLITFLAAVFFLFHKGLHFSVEFTGGMLLEVSYSSAAEVDKIREVLDKAGFKGDVQNFGTSRDVLIRLPVDKEKGSNASTEVMYALAQQAFKGKAVSTIADGEVRVEAEYAQDKSVDDLKSAVEAYGYSGTTIQELVPKKKFLVRVPARQEGKATPEVIAKQMTQTLTILDYDGKLRRVEFVGPQVGEELRDYGVIALVLSATLIVFYLWLRFEWRFGLAAIIANLHDVVIILGCFALFQWEFSLPVLAGVLAVLGYSVNESVVVFDRVRENFRKMRKASVPEVIDSSITAVISRTIITHGCTQAMVTTMLLFGGPALHYFALALTIGICFGIYSSVLVASPLVMWLGVDRSQFIRPPKKERGKDEHEGAVV